jgi:hypothetical protein
MLSFLKHGKGFGFPARALRSLAAWLSFSKRLDKEGGKALYSFLVME